jgi:hypothetical protein
MHGTRQPQPLYDKPRRIRIRPRPVRDDGNALNRSLQFARGVRRKRGILDSGADRAQHERQRFGGIVATLGVAVVDVADPDEDGDF